MSDGDLIPYPMPEVPGARNAFPRWHSGQGADPEQPAIEGTIVAADTVLYLLACRECGDGEDLSVIPFESASVRGRWASEHTRGTGHDRWLVKDQRA